MSEQDNKTQTPHYHGHRSRLRERFLQTNGHGMADYELLELLLFGALPRSDVKPLAKSLIAHFGSFADVIRAKPEELASFKQMGIVAQSILKSVQIAAIKILEHDMKEKPVLSHWDHVVNYCRAVMGHKTEEEFHLIFLNHKNHVIRDELHQKGTVNVVPVFPREIVKRALELSCSAVIMVHNHPGGDPTPSHADIKYTDDVNRALKAVNIKLHDHIIVTKGSQFTSFRQIGGIL
jgi:DNA repair protein RadC